MMRLMLLISSFFLGIAVCTAAPKPFALQSWRTTVGTKVLFYPRHEVPIVDINLAFAAGSARDGVQYGLAALCNDMLDQGSKDLSADQIAAKFAKTGALFYNEIDKDKAILGLRSLSNPNTFKDSFALFAHIISQVNFPKDAFARQKKNQLTAIKAQKQLGSTVADLAFEQLLYRQHPYAHATLGEEKTVTALSTEDIARFYQTFYTAQNAVLVIVGDLSRQQAESLANTLSQQLPQGQEASPLPKPKHVIEAETRIIRFPGTQTNVRLGQFGITREDPNYFPLRLANYSLGGGSLVSQLFQQVRDNRGLSYFIYSQFIPMSTTGSFIVSFSSRHKKVNTALNITQKVIRDFIKRGITPDELKHAKQFYIGNFPLQLASNRKISLNLLNIAFYHLPDNYLNTYQANINAVTLEQAQTALRETLNPNKFVTVMVGQPPA